MLHSHVCVQMNNIVNFCLFYLIQLIKSLLIAKNCDYGKSKHYFLNNDYKPFVCYLLGFCKWQNLSTKNTLTPCCGTFFAVVLYELRWVTLNYAYITWGCAPARHAAALQMVETRCLPEFRGRWCEKISPVTAGENNNNKKLYKLSSLGWCKWIYVKVIPISFFIVNYGGKII